ncbi:MAG: class I SAM-dependent methyltransferase [Candidatus Aenigmarchaeota archaeon]|nr:class I SAM-dependent methyltransferase [Candidatus Aenigmarchaeota archaeon]
MIGTNDKVKRYVEKSEDPWGLKRAGMDKRRASLIKRCIGKSGLVMDIGCAFGIYSDFLKKIGNFVISTDASKRMVVEGRKNFGGLHFVAGHGESLPYKSGMFDAVLCMGTLIYSSDRRAFLSELHRVLRKGGKLCVIERNKNSPLHLIVRKAKRNEQSVDNPETYFTKKDLKSLLAGAGFRIKRIRGDRISLPFITNLTSPLAERLPSLAYFLVFECEKE